MSSLGVVEISAIDDKPVPQANFVTAVREAYDDVLNWETGQGASGPA
jgi:hypothetical protein